MDGFQPYRSQPSMPHSMGIIPDFHHLHMKARFCVNCVSIKDSQHCSIRCCHLERVPTSVSRGSPLPRLCSGRTCSSPAASFYLFILSIYSILCSRVLSRLSTGRSFSLCLQGQVPDSLKDIQNHRYNNGLSFSGPLPSRIMPLKAADLLAHPAYEHLPWKLSPTESDYCTVAGGRRGGPFKLWYEVHGKGKTRMVVSQTHVVPCANIRTRRNSNLIRSSS